MSKNESVRAGRILDANIHLLDRQVLDVSGTPVTTVDDVELEEVPRGTDLDPQAPGPLVTDLLTGPVLATRILGGRPPASRWLRIDWGHVRDIGTAIRLGVAGDDLELTWSERWVRDHVIRRIPGGSHDPE